MSNLAEHDVRKKIFIGCDAMRMLAATRDIQYRDEIPNAVPDVRIYRFDDLQQFGNLQSEPVSRPIAHNKDAIR